MSEPINLPITAVPRTWTENDPAQEPNHFKLAVVNEVIDGDSVWMFIDTDFEDIFARRNCRFIGIDAPDKQPDKAASKAWLQERLPVGTPVYLYLPRKDKYGRPLVGVYTSLTGTSLNLQSLEAGMSKPYDGGARGGEISGE